MALHCFELPEVELEDIVLNLKKHYPELFLTPPIADLGKSLDNEVLRKDLDLYDSLSRSITGRIYLSGANRIVVMSDLNDGILKPVYFAIEASEFRTEGDPFDLSNYKGKQHPVDFKVIPRSPELVKNRCPSIIGSYLFEGKNYKMAAARFKGRRNTVEVINFFMRTEGVLEVGQLRENQYSGRLCFPYKRYDHPPVTIVKEAEQLNLFK